MRLSGLKYEIKYDNLFPGLVLLTFSSGYNLIRYNSLTSPVGVGRSVGQSVGWPVGWLVGGPVGWSVGLLVSRSVSRSVGWLVGWCSSQPVGRSVSLLVGRSVGRSVGLSVGRSSLVRYMLKLQARTEKDHEPFHWENGFH